MNLIMAVLTKHARLRLHTVDCHTNVVGGLTLTEPATDLAVALAIASSYYDRPISPNLAAIGEIGEALHSCPLHRCPLTCDPSLIISTLQALKDGWHSCTSGVKTSRCKSLTSQALRPEKPWTDAAADAALPSLYKREARPINVYITAQPWAWHSGERWLMSTPVVGTCAQGLEVSCGRPTT